MEAQLKLIIKSNTDATDAMGEEMKKYNKEEFFEVITGLDYLCDAVLKKGLEGVTLQDFGSIKNWDGGSECSNSLGCD